MKNVRIWFKKAGAARYISHLDLTRCMSRALKLSGLPVWYTEGFNPRIYMTYAMPLSLGIWGERECMDIRLTEDREFSEIVRLLNNHLPADIRVFDAAEPLMGFDQIAFAEYTLLLETDAPAALTEKFQKLLEQDEILVLKHSKKGDRELNIKPYFQEMRVELAGEAGLKLFFRLPCSLSGSVNPGLLLEALKRYEGEEPYGEIHRNRLLTKDFSEIR